MTVENDKMKNKSKVPLIGSWPAREVIGLMRKQPMTCRDERCMCSCKEGRILEGACTVGSICGKAKRMVRSIGGSFRLLFGLPVIFNQMTQDLPDRVTGYRL